jgi:DNA-binding Lrp family transcriptional regulator
LDEVDEEILELLYQAGNTGMLPRDLAARLTQFGIRRHQVSRRIQRMNKRVEKEIGETIIEKRGWHWSLTSFSFEAWGESERRT